MNILLTQVISFPNLGISLKDVPAELSVSGNVSLSLYGIMTGLAIIIGSLIVFWQAQTTGQRKELYLDIAIPVIFFSVIGARFFYIIFSLEDLNRNSVNILFTGGGLAWYGALAAGGVFLFIYAKVKRLNVSLIADTISAGLLAGQAVGKWGDFFLRKSFGRFTDNIFAMRLSVEDVDQNAITSQMLAAAEKHGYTGFIQVHPLFFYESVLDLILMIGILFYYRHKKFDGEIFLIYLAGYGFLKGWIESLSTDPLHIWGTSIGVTQVISLIVMVTSISILIVKRVDLARESHFIT